MVCARSFASAVIILAPCLSAGFIFHVSNDRTSARSCARNADRAQVMHGIQVPPDERAQGRPGVRCARSLVCKIKNIRVSHHRFTGSIRPSLHNGFTASFVLAPETGLVVSVASAMREHRRRLDNQRRDIRPTRLRRPPQARSSCVANAATASRPTFVTMANAPPSEAGWRGLVEMICPTGETKYFCVRDWTVDSALIAFWKFDFWRNSVSVIPGRRASAISRVPDAARH